MPRAVRRLDLEAAFWLPRLRPEAAFWLPRLRPEAAFWLPRRKTSIKARCIATREECERCCSGDLFSS